jgi:hypothetical protein
LPRDDKTNNLLARANVLRYRLTESGDQISSHCLLINGQRE